MTALRNDIRTRLFLNSDWRDVSTHVRYEQGISIRRGYGAEDELAPPSTCKFTLDNGANKGNGDYTERNPLGQWYGYLGRSTPVEVACRVAKDTATTAASNGWGTTEAHADGAYGALTWTSATSGSGSGTADFDKTSGKARHVLTGAGSVRVSYLAAVSMRELDCVITVNIPTNNVTGTSLTSGIAAANIVLRGQGALSDYFMLRLIAQTDESFTMDWWAATGGGGPASITGDAYVDITGITQASQDIKVRVQAEGRTLRAKMWNASASEPFSWHLTTTVEDDLASTLLIRDAAGWVGVRSSLTATNTNGPITISYDNFELFSPEFAGEIPSWPRNRDETGNDRTVSITASDITRRLSTGESPLNSALRRNVLINPYAGVLPVAYWPLEDGVGADPDRVLSATGLGQLGFLPPTAGTTVGKVTWAAERTLPGGSQAPSLTGGASLVAFLNPPSSPSQWMISFCIKQSYSDGTYVQLTTQSGYLNLILTRNPSALGIDISLSIDNGAASSILTYTFASKNDVEEWHQVNISAVQTGADIDFFLEIDGAFADSFTETTETLEGLLRAQLSSVTNASQNTSFAHVLIYNNAFFPTAASLYEAFTGYNSERALSRAQRLCEEEGIEFDWIGAGIGNGTPNTEPMGPQKPETLLSLVQSCAKVDNGLLYSQRTINGFQFRTLQTMYARDPWATLSMSGGHFSPPWGATSDDRALRNDITANRVDGGSVRHELDDGSRMSVSSPADGGAGRYDSSVTVNTESDSQLFGQAAWRVHIGTADEDRFPALQLDLARAVFRDTAGLALAAKLRDLDIGDLITLADMESDDIYDDLSELVVGIQKQIDQVSYRMTLVCRPGSRYNTGILGTDWRLDADDTTTNEALDTTETGVDVAIASGGAIWTAADQPFDVMIGGERMTVTAVTGSSSPQTLTVTRSVNGVVKSHATGAPVVLADPNYLGL